MILSWFQETTAALRSIGKSRLVGQDGRIAHKEDTWMDCGESQLVFKAVSTMSQKEDAASLLKSTKMKLLSAKR